MFKNKYGKEGTEGDLNKLITDNRLNFEKTTYDWLSQQARKTDTSISADPLYQQFQSEKLKAETPIQEVSQSWKDKALSVGKGLIDTTVGLGAIASDVVTGKDSYKEWFSGPHSNEYILKANA